MLIGAWKTATLTFATDSQNTAEVNLGSDFEAIEIDVPTIESAEIQAKVANETGGTFDLIGVEEPVQASTGGFRTTLPLGGKYQFVKIYLSAAQTANRSFSVRGISYAAGGLVAVIDKLKHLITGVVLAEGSATIGKLAANSGVDIGDVDVASIAAGTNRIGTVSGVLKSVSVTKVLVAATAYDAADVLSESATNGVGTAWTFSAIARANGTGGYITKAHVISETTAITPRLVLYLFKAAPTCELDDHAANTALLHADLANYIGRIDFPAMSEHGTGDAETLATPSTIGSLPLAFECAAGADDLFGVLVTLDAFTQDAADDMTIVLTADQY